MKTLMINGQLLNLDKPKVMGILNLTTDSFYDGGQYLVLDKALHRVEQMLEEGSSIIDLGAFSSRPGADIISQMSQIKALEPVVKGIISRFPDIMLSIDTNQSEVAEAIAGLCHFLVNDISGFSQDKRLLDVVSEYKLPYVLMHMRGTPKTMQEKTSYTDITFDILDYLAKKLDVLRRKGIIEVLIDPGFGFAKTTTQNFELLKKLNLFNVFECPLMVGLSRKSMIYKTLGLTPEQSLNGSTALHMAALSNGAKILRVHDVKEATETITLWQQLEPSVNH